MAWLKMNSRQGLLWILLAMLALPAAVKAQYGYADNRDGTCTITGYTGEGGDVVITNTITGLQVTGIGDAAFFNCPTLTTVAIGNGVISIGRYAFLACDNLTAITVDTNNPAFSSLDGVLFDKSQTTLIQCPGAKSGAYTIPNGVTNIGIAAFDYCNSLTNVTIPGSVTNIGEYAFLACHRLTAITVDTNNPAYSSVGGVLLDKSQNTLIQCPAGKAGTFTIPDSVNSIGENGFNGCRILTSVTIGTHVASLGNEAFDGCFSLTTATIPASVASMGDYAFGGCTNLTSVYFQGNAPTLGWYPFEGDAKATVYYFPSTTGWGATFGGRPTVPLGYDYADNGDGTCTITGYSGGDINVTTPNTISNLTVTSIGDAAFLDCTNLTGVTIPNNVTGIGVCAFSFCSSLTSFTIGTNIASIGHGTFTSCATLTNVTIGTNVTSIGNGAFSFCSSLPSVTIPASVTNIGISGFRDCTSLTSIYFRGNAPNLGPLGFTNDNNATVYYLPGTTNWTNPWGGLPTVLWNPQVLSNDGNFGVRTNCFGFTFTNGGSPTIVVEACTNLLNPAWSPLATNTLTGGSAYFGDPGWTNCPARFYRFRSP